MRRSPLVTLVDAVFRPARFLASRPTTDGRGLASRGRTLAHALVALVVNLALYAVPVAVGYTVVTGDTLGSVLAYVAYPFVLLVGVTLWAFHGAVVATGNSRGLVESAQTVATAAGVYLALAVGFLYPLLVAPGALGAFLRGATMYLFVFDAGTATAPPPGVLAAVGGVVAACYYAYSLYAAARVRHGASRVDAVLVAAVPLAMPPLTTPWLLSAPESALPPALFSTPVVVLGGVVMGVTLLAVAVDLLW
jgi:hypothetical protein